mmetsp:Transcript_53104/g.60869  ORF Transcript_53104/g.60869 Transcript_53104/m.60869 type:complete len:187 (-) Transcript_53104:276-836(-)
MSSHHRNSPDPWSALEERYNESPFEEYSPTDFHGVGQQGSTSVEDDFVFSRSNFVSFGKDPTRQSDPFTLHAKSLHSKHAEIQQRNSRIKVFNSGNLVYSHRSLRVEVKPETVEDARMALTERLHDLMSKHGKFLVCNVYGDKEIRCYMVVDRDITNDTVLDLVQDALIGLSVSQPVITELRSKGY